MNGSNFFKRSINVFSEIGKLKTVLMHKPNRELENIPGESKWLQTLLFEDTPHLKVAQAEHQYFADLLGKNGVEVIYVEELFREVLEINAKIKNEIIEQFILEGKVEPKYVDQLKSYLLNLSASELVIEMIAGTKKVQLKIKEDEVDSPFLTLPMPNLLFQRDCFASIGEGVAINKMKFLVRNRETLFCYFIFKYHPRFKNSPHYYERSYEHTLEGGDVLVLNPEIIIIGLTERTELSSVKKLFSELISRKSGFKRILLIDLKQKNRAFMHLDTVFTQIDYNKFLVHPNIFRDKGNFRLVELSFDNSEKIIETNINSDLNEYLSQLLNQEIIFIPGGGQLNDKNEIEIDYVTASREQ
jgi:arginine deiminase